MLASRSTCTEIASLEAELPTTTSALLKGVSGSTPAAARNDDTGTGRPVACDGVVHFNDVRLYEE